MEEPAPEPESQVTSSSTVVCPNCGAELDPSITSGPVIECPSCNTQFFPPGSSQDESTDEQEEVEAKKSSLEEELSQLRIKQLATLRRTAYTTRSYLIVAMLGCAWFTIPLTIAIVQFVKEKHGWGLWPSAYVMMGLASIIAAYKFGVRALDVQRGIVADLRARELEELEAAKHEPDLSALSDGSQYAKLLEQMVAGMREEASANETKEYEE